MYNPTTRLLTILELLQSRGEISGLELAQILEVEVRSIRRYIMMLRDMGIPIDGERGRHGGYSLRPGFRLPPLMFNANEITAVIMGLIITRELGITSIPAIESAAAKIERVLPAKLRQSTDALRRSLTVDSIQFGVRNIPNEWVVLFSLAIEEGKCLRITYRSGQDDITERTIAPYGLLLHARTWYLPAYCYLREDMRVFRLDRVKSVAATTQTFTKPVNFDARAIVLDSLAQLPGTQLFEVLVHAPLLTVQEYISPSTAILENRGGETLMRCYSDSADWLARYLTRVELPFTVLANDELRDALRSLADEILGSL